MCLEDKSIPTPKTKTQFQIFQKPKAVKKTQRPNDQEVLDDVRGLLGREIQRLEEDQARIVEKLKEDEGLIQGDQLVRNPEQGLGTSELDQEREWVIHEIQRRIASDGDFLGNIRSFLKGGEALKEESPRLRGGKLRAGHETGEERSALDLASADLRKPVTDPNWRENGKRSGTSNHIDIGVKEIERDFKPELRKPGAVGLAASERRSDLEAETGSVVENPETPNPEFVEFEKKQGLLRGDFESKEKVDKGGLKASVEGNAVRLGKKRLGRQGGSGQLFNLRVSNRKEISVPSLVSTFKEESDREEADKGDGRSWDKSKARVGRNKKPSLDPKANPIVKAKTHPNSHLKASSKASANLKGNNAPNVERSRDETEPRAGTGRKGGRRSVVWEKNSAEIRNTRKTPKSIDKSLDMMHRYRDEARGEAEVVTKEKSKKGTVQGKTFDWGLRKIVNPKNGPKTGKDRDLGAEKGTRNLGTAILEFKPKEDKSNVLQSGSSNNHRTSGSEGPVLVQRSSTQNSNLSMLKPKHLTSRKDVTTDKELRDSSAHNHLFIPSKQLSGEDELQFCLSKKQLGDTNGVSLEQNFFRITHETNDSRLFFSKKRTSEANLLADVTGFEAPGLNKASREMGSLRIDSNGSQRFLNCPRSQAGTLLSNLSAGIGSFPFGSNRGGGRSSQGNTLLAPEFETDLMSTMEKKMTQLNRGSDLERSGHGPVAKRNRREIDMEWIVKDSEGKSRDANWDGDGSKAVEGSERGMQKASNRFLFLEDEEVKEERESLWSQSESFRANEDPQLDDTPAVLPPSLQAVKNCQDKEAVESEAGVSRKMSRFGNQREIFLPDLGLQAESGKLTHSKDKDRIQMTDENHQISKALISQGELGDAAAGGQARPQIRGHLQKQGGPEKKETGIRESCYSKEIKGQGARQGEELTFGDLSKKTFSKTEPDNKINKRKDVTGNLKLINDLEKNYPLKETGSPRNGDSEKAGQAQKERVCKEREKSLRQQTQEQAIRIQELSTKYKGLEELLNQTERKKRELEKRAKVHEAKLRQKERHANKVEAVLRKFHSKLKEFPVPKMGFQSRTDLNFLERQNWKFVKTAHRNQGLLKKQAEALKAAEAKVRVAELSSKEREQEVMDLKDRMGAHRARAERVEREILEVRERNQKYSDLIRNLEDSIMGLETELASKKKENLRMKKREKKCSTCSQRSIKHLASRNLNQIEEESHSSLDVEPAGAEDFVTLEEFNEIKQDKNEWKGRYNELNFKFMKTCQSLRKKDVKVKYLIDNINHLNKELEKFKLQKRKRPIRDSRKEVLGSGRL